MLDVEHYLPRCWGTVPEAFLILKLAPGYDRNRPGHGGGIARLAAADLLGFKMQLKRIYTSGKYPANAYVDTFEGMTGWATIKLMTEGETVIVKSPHGFRQLEFPVEAIPAILELLDDMTAGWWTEVK